MKKLLITLVALVLIAAACGSSSSVTVGGADGGQTDGSSDDGASDGSSDDGGDDNGDGSGDGGGDGSLSAFCAFAAEREANEDMFDEINVFVPEELQAGFDTNRQLLADAISVAPPGVLEHLLVVQMDLDETYDRLMEAGFDITQMVDEDFADSAEVEAAGNAIDTFVEDNCGIDPDANEDAGPTDDQLAEMLEESGQADEFVAQILAQLGFDEEEAACLATGLTMEDFEELAAGNVQDEILSVFTDCGVSMQELAEMGGADPEELNEGLGDQLENLPPGAVDQIAAGLELQGFTPEEAACLATALFEAGGADADIFEAIDACDISLARMAEIGQG